MLSRTYKRYKNDTAPVTFAAERFPPPRDLTALEHSLLSRRSISTLVPYKNDRRSSNHYYVSAPRKQPS